MKVGILEVKDDPFIKDLIARLKDLKTDFISVRDIDLPIKSDYRVVVDRISYGTPYLTELIKSLSLGGAYVINNPFSSIMKNKIIDIKICESLGIPYPKTIVLPGMDENWDLGDSVKEPDFDRILREIDLPCYLKPYDGFGWDNVYLVNSVSELKNLYDSLKFRFTLMIQEKIEHHDYYRTFCVNKRDVLFIKYVPKPFMMGQFIFSDLKPLEGIKEKLEKWTIRLNKASDLDFNVTEWCIDENGNPFVIDNFNDIPQVDKGIPEPYYNWIIEKLAECVKEKLNSGERNKTTFSLEIKE
jgi:hypothetical protein